MRKRVFSALLLAAGLSLVLFGALTALLLEVTGKQLLLMGVVLVVSATISTLFVRKIGLRLLGELKEPLKTAEKALDHIAAGEVYAVDWSKTEGEYLSLFQAIERLEGRIHSLTSERDKVNLILDCMDEGVVLLDEHTELLASNRAARKLFHMPEDAENTEITDYIRSRRLTEAINLLQRKKESVVLDMEHPRRKGRSLRFFLSPVTGQKYQGQQVGMSILISDVTELKRAEGIRSEFTANVSHELKTPLTSILGYTEIIGNGLANESDIPKFADRIHKEAARLLTLIEDIIKLSQLDEDELRAEFVPVELSELCQNVLQELSQKAEKAGVTLHFSGSEQTVSGFEPSLYEMIYNLCDNAIAYNKPGGSVNVSLEKTPEDKIRLTVRDTGIGIAEEHLGRVFERFYRVDKSHSKETGGTGLGLSIVKHAALMHDAELSIESTPQVGTTVQILFKPLKTN